MTTRAKVKAVHREQRARVRRRQTREKMGFDNQDRYGIMDQSGNIIARSVAELATKFAPQKKG